jgi:hypothetical protein
LQTKALCINVWFMTTKIPAALTLCAIAISLRADQVVMQNGDHYNGKVLSMTTNSLVLQNDNLGKVTLPRGKVIVITLGSETATNFSQLTATVPSRGSAATQTNADSELAAQFRQLATHTNLIEQVRGQFLAGATPEANRQFDQMLNDLTTGKMTLASLRAQAKDAADQLRALEKESGDDDTGTMDIYLSILDHFLQEAAPPGESTTNATANLPKSNPTPAKK